MSTPRPHLRPPQGRVLALWRDGMAMPPAWGRLPGATGLALQLGQPVATLAPRCQAGGGEAARRPAPAPSAGGRPGFWG